MGLKEVSSKKLHLDNRESSSSKSHRHENVTNTNLLEKEDTQSQHVKGVQRIEKRVSFHNESESGDFVPDDVIKYEDNKLVRVSVNDNGSIFLVRSGQVMVGLNCCSFD